MAVPVLRALRNAYPASHISVACVQKNLAVFQLLTFQNELIQLEKPSAVFKLWKDRFDVILDLEPFRRTSSVVTWFTRAPVRVGFDTGARRILYTHLVTYAHDHLFEAANMARQLEIVGINASARETADLTFELPESFSLEAEQILGAHGSKGRLIAVAPGVLKPHHRWDMRKWAEVVRSILTEDTNLSVALVGGAGDRPDADNVLYAIANQERIIDLVGKLDFTHSLAILKRCEVLLACDGGVVYMAAAMGCPTISLWGPGVMERFKPPGESHIGVRKNYACIPCVTWNRLGEFPRCPYNRKCYNDVSADEVLEHYYRSAPR